MRFAKGTTFEKDVELKALDGFSNEIATCVTDTFCFTGIAVYVGGFYDAGGYVGAMFWNGKVWTMMPEGRVDFPQERLPAYRNMNFFVGVFGVECISTKACFMFGALEAAQGWNGYEAVGDFVFIYDTGKPKVPQLVRSSLAPRNGTRRFFHGMKCVPQRKVCHLAMWSSQLPSSMWAITPK